MDMWALSWESPSWRDCEETLTGRKTRGFNTPASVFWAWYCFGGLLALRKSERSEVFEPKLNSGVFHMFSFDVTAKENARFLLMEVPMQWRRRAFEFT
jgi:hypothetical protein